MALVRSNYLKHQILPRNQSMTVKGLGSDWRHKGPQTKVYELSPNLAHSHPQY